MYFQVLCFVSFQVWTVIGFTRAYSINNTKGAGVAYIIAALWGVTYALTIALDKAYYG